jgi:hypothetical protein
MAECRLGLVEGKPGGDNGVVPALMQPRQLRFFVKLIVCRVIEENRRNMKINRS